MSGQSGFMTLLLLLVSSQSIIKPLELLRDAALSGDATLSFPSLEYKNGQ